MSVVFADTSALFAVLDGAEQNHHRARGVWERLLREESILLTTNYVLLETCALLQNRLGLAALRRFQDDVWPVLEVEWITGQTHRAGVEAVLMAGRKKLSLVDCVSFQVMRERGVRTAFCFDAHFREQGFEALP